MDLKEYFSTHWITPDGGSEIEQYKYTGFGLLKEVKETDNVLDVGCGTNPFKPYLGDRVWGIDMTDIGSDEQVLIEDFKSDKKYDIAFILGSINFGDSGLVSRQIEAVVNSLKKDSKIFWRCNPGYHDHNNKYVTEIDFFPWSLEWHIYFSEQFGYEIDEFAWDGKNGAYNRMYVKWVKKRVRRDKPIIVKNPWD